MKRHQLVIPYIMVSVMALGLYACATRIPANLTVYFRDQAYLVSLPVQLHLEEVAAYLKSHADSSVEIQGHATDSKSCRSNQKTAERLSKLFGNYLLGLGVSPNQVELSSYVSDQSREKGPYVYVKLKTRLAATRI